MGETDINEFVNRGKNETNYLNPRMLQSNYVQAIEEVLYSYERELPECMSDTEKEIREFLCEKISPIVTGNKLVFDTKMELDLSDCESPIERLLELGFKSIGLSGFKDNYISSINIKKQKAIFCGKIKYRVDFLIEVLLKNKAFKLFVVECDGHEFHEKTKEQVVYDNERTRALQIEGYEVIRFSGTEIWNRPHKCAMQVLRIILSKCEYLGLIEEEKRNG